MKNLRNVVGAGVAGLGGLTLVLALLLSVGAIQARPATTFYYVHEGESIQAIIDLAQPGDQIWIAGGVYSENLSITRSVALRGSWDAAFTTQDWMTPTTLMSAVSSEHNIRVEAATPATDTVLLEGLSLRNGQDGIHIWTGNVTAQHMAILNAAGRGIGIGGGTVLISATQILTVQQGMVVTTGMVSVFNTTIAHVQSEGLLIESQGMPLSVTLTGSLIEYTGRQGIYGKGGVLQVLSSEVHHVISDGIQLEGGTATITDSSIHDGLSLSQPGIYSLGAAVALIGNRIYNVQDHGVQVRAGPPTVITNNQVYSTTGYGIYTRDMTAYIAGNMVYNTGDRGIYARGGAATIVSNTLHDIGDDGIRTDSSNTDVVIRDNTLTTVQGDGIEAQGKRITLLHNRVTGVVDNALKTDNVGTWALIEANVALDSGTGLAVRSGPIFTLTNNLLAGNTTSALEIGALGGTQTGRGFIAHNTLVGGGTGMMVWTPFSMTMVNNIVVSSSVGISLSVSALPTATLSVDHTLLWGNVADPITGTNALTQPPRFIDPATGDYHLQADSPAVNAGVDAGVTVDWEGDVRPQGVAPDIGADELREAHQTQVYLPLIQREFYEGPIKLAAPPVYRLYADPGQLEWLEGDPYRNDPIPATFVAERPWSVDLRYRGDTSRTMPKKSWKVEFSESDPFSRSEEINLNADYVDQTLLRSAVGYDFLARAGIPTPRHTYARLYLNDAYYGLFSNVEQIDELFLNRMGWDLHGNLYKGDGNLEPPKWYEDNPQWWDANYSKHTNDLNGYDDIRALIDLVNNTPDAQFPAAIAEKFDVNGWLDWYAANILLGNFEMVAKNYYLYHDFSADKWRILPWDVDLALGHNATFHSVFDYDLTWDNPIDSGTLNSKKVDGKWNVLIEHMMRVPEFRYFHARRLIEMMAGPFMTDTMFAKIDAFYTQIQPYGEADPNRWKPGGFTFPYGPTELKQYVTQRRIWLYENLPAFMPALKPPLVFNEINSAQSVELYNTSSVLTWDLGGMTIGDGLTRQRIPDGTRIPPRGVWHGDLLFTPTGNTLTLYDRDCFANAVIATVTYPALASDTSYARWPDGTGGWQSLSTPTPGWLNVGRPPVITSVTNTVALANKPVTVTATISDVGNITATLWYRTHQPLESAPAVYNAIPLVAGAISTQYTAVLPAFPAGTWVEFYLEASDSVGLVTTDRLGWNATGLGRDYRYVVGWQRPALFINELMAINDKTIDDVNGNPSDWIELYNAGATDIDLGGMSLTDDPLVPTRRQLPSGLIVPAGGTLLLWASDEISADHLGFKLNGIGEEVALFDRVDRGLGMIDVVFYTPQSRDVSWGRYPDGSATWKAMDSPTPGAVNRLLPPTFSQVTREPRWPTTSQAATVRAQLTGGTPPVSVTLWLDTGGGFQPSVLTLGNGFYQATIPAQANGTLVRYYFEAVDARGQRTVYPTPAPQSSERYLVGYTPPALVVNEFLALNNSVIRDEAGQYEDWLELYNAGTTSLNLGGLYLSDDFGNPRKWSFPISLTLAPDGYLLIWCDEDADQGPLHASFKLSGGGEEIVLSADDAHGNVPIDWITFGPQTPDISYGRQPDGAATWITFATPTPGRSNQ